MNMYSTRVQVYLFCYFHLPKLSSTFISNARYQRLLIVAALSSLESVLGNWSRTTYLHLLHSFMHKVLILYETSFVRLVDLFLQQAILNLSKLIRVYLSKYIYQFTMKLSFCTILAEEVRGNQNLSSRPIRVMRPCKFHKSQSLATANNS